VNEQAMMNVVNSLFNHIEDLEEFIYTARGVEYNEGDEGGVRSENVHFDEDLFTT
jgi:hypothetical protein